MPRSYWHVTERQELNALQQLTELYLEAFKGSFKHVKPVRGRMGGWVWVGGWEAWVCVGGYACRVGLDEGVGWGGDVRGCKLELHTKPVTCDARHALQYTMCNTRHAVGCKCGTPCILRDHLQGGTRTQTNTQETCCACNAQAPLSLSRNAPAPPPSPPILPTPCRLMTCPTSVL
jgi:hypothetical protein